jgi:hypothetical protein
MSSSNINNTLNELLTSCISSVHTDIDNAISLELYTDENFEIDSKFFADNFILCYNELKATPKGLKYFITRKTDKLRKELNNRVPFVELIGNIAHSDNIWLLLQKSAFCIEKETTEDEKIMNTIALEIGKLDDIIGKNAIIVAETEGKKKKKRSKIEFDPVTHKPKGTVPDFNKLTENVMEEMKRRNIDINSLDNPQELMKVMMSNFGSSFESIVKNTSGEGGDITDMAKGLAENMGLDEGSEGGGGLMDMLQGFIDTTDGGECDEEIYDMLKTDLFFLLEDIENVLQNGKKIGEKYREMLEADESMAERLTFSIILKLLKDEDVVAKLNTIDKDKIDITTLIQQIMSECGMEEFAEGGDMAGMFDMVKGMLMKKKEEPDMELTDAQMDELYEHFEKQQIEDGDVEEGV